MDMGRGKCPSLVVHGEQLFRCIGGSLGVFQ